MPTRLVTCPETAHLELLTYEDHPMGMLVVECTRFEPGPPDCPRTCAERMDCRARQCREIDPEVERSLEVGDETHLGIDLNV
ncbi:MAG: hypothetical protein R3B48_00890 [Kofleriaceae bacterium]